jgi:hypothetical protein
MESYKTRWQSLTKDVRENKPADISVHKYCELIKKCRCGDYVIKVSKNNAWHGMGCYIQFDYGLSAGMSFGRRSEAAWFTKEEASEFIKPAVGFVMVKLSKNKK